MQFGVQGELQSVTKWCRENKNVHKFGYNVMYGYRYKTKAELLY